MTTSGPFVGASHETQKEKLEPQHQDYVCPPRAHTRVSDTILHGKESVCFRGQVVLRPGGHRGKLQMDMGHPTVVFWEQQDAPYPSVIFLYVLRDIEPPVL